MSADHNVKLLGVVGAGQMGGGIAQVAGERGIAVVLVDATQELAERGKRRIADQLEKLVQKGKLAAEARDKTLAHIQPSGSLSVLVDCDFVVEAATENQE